MMSQNRQAAKDRLHAQDDFEINCKAETEIEVLMRQTAYQSQMILDLQKQLNEVHGRMCRETGLRSAQADRE